jgi:hypothetical protein
MTGDLDDPEMGLSRQAAAVRERCLEQQGRVDLFERHGQDATGAKVLLFVYRETLELMEKDLATLQKRRKISPG